MRAMLRWLKLCSKGLLRAWSHGRPSVHLLCTNLRTRQPIYPIRSWSPKPPRPPLRPEGLTQQFVSLFPKTNKPHFVHGEHENNHNKGSKKTFRPWLTTHYDNTKRISTNCLISYKIIKRKTKSITKQDPKKKKKKFQSLHNFSSSSILYSIKQNH